MLQKKKAFRISSVVLVVMSFFAFACQNINSIPKVDAVTIDQDNGTYSDDFSDATGISSTSQAGVNTGTGKVQLKKNDGSGAYASPYYTSGYVITDTIIPTSIVSWGEITFSATVPDNTSVNIQLLDELNTLFSNNVLTGNSTGFAASPIDISSLPPLISATGPAISAAKIGRLRIKISLSTSDTSSTPTVDSLNLSWTTKQGSTSAELFNSNDWHSPFVDQQATLHKTTKNQQGYSVFKWASDKYYGYAIGGSSLLIYNNQLISSAWYNKDNNSDYIRSFNRDTGAATWQTPVSERGYITIGSGGTAYHTDMTEDIFSTIDLEDGSLMWTYAFSSGHGNDNVIIDDDGTIYTVRNQNTSSNVVTIYAFNPDGTTKWTKNITDTMAGGIWPGAMSRSDNGTLYFGTHNSDYSDGNLYSFDPETQTVNWIYNTGVITWYPPPLIDSGGVVYVGNYYSSGIDQKIYAINSDGTLKWSKDYSDSGDLGYSYMTLQSDGTLIAGLYQEYSSYAPSSTQLQYINTSDGSLIKTQNLSDLGIAFTDSDDHLYYSSIEDGSSDHEKFATFGYYNQNGGEIWQAPYAFNNQNGTNVVKYAFTNQSGASSLIQDDRGWLYGSIKRMEGTSGGSAVASDDSFIQYFALAPWTLSLSGLSGDLQFGDTINLTATSSMGASNPFISGNNKIQVILDNGDKVELTYSSTSGSNYLWTGSYTIPSNLSLGSHSFTVEASQAYMQTDIVTHFASATEGSGNTGITYLGTFNIVTTSGPALTILPETGANFAPIISIKNEEIYNEDELSLPAFFDRY